MTALISFSSFLPTSVPLTFYICGERCKASPWLWIETKMFLDLDFFKQKVTMRHNRQNYLMIKMLTTPLYWWGKIQSCHPVADVCWMTLLLEEKVSLNQETAEAEWTMRRTHVEYNVCPPMKLPKTTHWSTFNRFVLSVLTPMLSQISRLLV